ncbi:hypothetical protein MOQ_002400 [Trypanosoma cruzi marinkellei]|uniref:Myosin heavy chain n=1 Tax=Trypanosoma cruzi marinkellei TaxID=85056 RepID=K2MFC5_TRYCR|nr:hypothetical protein MOQ_002400 [Trypanosoma cruzi marinkellei]
MQEPNQVKLASKKVVRLTRVRRSVDMNDTSNISASTGTSSLHDQPVEMPCASHVNPPMDGVTAPASSPPDVTQVVNSLEEGNALVKRLRQLENENASLASALTKVCDDNANLAKHIVKQEEKCVELSTSPISATSVLRSLFEPEKVGWFGGSKTAARENLEKMMEELQNEFIDYQASHASSNDEVQALIGELQSAHMNAQQLSTILHEQQKVISRGPLSVAVRIFPLETAAERVSLVDLRHELELRSERENELRQELSKAREELQVKVVENARLQRDLQALRLEDNHSNEVERQYMTDEISRLKTEVAQLRKALATEEQLHRLKVGENAALSQRLSETESRLRASNAEMRAQPSEAPCDRCGELQRECDVANERLQTVTREMQQLGMRLSELKQANEEEVNELQREKSELEEKLNHSVARDTLAAAESQNKHLLQELEFTSARVKELEELIERERQKITSDAVKSSDESRGTLKDSEILEALERNRERIARVEFQRDQLMEEAKQLRAIAVTKEEELIRLNRASQEDKQRINFLLKRCVTLTGDLNNSIAAKDALNEEYENAQLKLKKLLREGEEMVRLQQQVMDLKKENDALQDRLSNVEVLENNLVKAKETIAYMELAKSQTINMSQYAELQSKTSKLENTLEPIKKQLEEARKELGRIKNENESLHAVLTRQQNTIKSHEEQMEALQANDAKMRDKTNQLTSENTRLRDVNETLEAQMNNMQDGIKEMAVKLEQERTRAQVAAEATHKEEIAQLRRKLESANATLATMQSTQENFVPEAIHKAVVAEKGHVSEELRQKTFDLDRLKSEILIYRQTINDLETENEEHVRQIESLQESHKKDLTTAADRLSVETRKVTEANEELEGLHMQINELQQREERLLSRQKEMEEAAQKHRRAFEDKCRQEEQLLQTITATNQEMETQNEELAKVKSALLEYQRQNAQLESEMKSGAAQGPRQQEDMESELETLRDEIQRVNGEKNTLEMELGKLRKAIKNGNWDSNGGGVESSGSNNNTDNTHNNNNNNSTAMRGKSVDDHGGHVNMETGMSSDAAVQYARAEQLQMSLIQAQRQLEEQRRVTAEAAETFDKALDKADAEAEALRERIRELESELHRMAPESDETRSFSSAHPKKQKKKKTVKKSLSTLAKIDDLQETDVLAVAAADEGVRQQQQQQLEQQRESLEKLEQELSILRDENVRLKENIATLTQELVGAHDDFELARKTVDSTTAELRGQIQLLEAQLRNCSANTDGETELHRLAEENKQLQSEVSLLSDSMNATIGNSDVTVQRLKAELRALAKELVPTKNKLVEYMAMADRLGIHYPFSPDMEGVAVLRLKAMHFDTATGRVRAYSAPRQPYASSFDKNRVSPGAKRKKRVKKHQPQGSHVDKLSDLR